MRWLWMPLFIGLAAAQEPARVAAVDHFTEGPVFDEDGNLFFSERNRVFRLAPGGELSVWLEASANGHKILPDGTHLVCSPESSAILHVAADGEVLGNAADECEGAPLRQPNDLTLDSFGGFYFTDPGGSRERPIGTVCYVDAERRTRLVASGMWVPNGLVLSPDGRTLYVAETLPNRILRFDVEAPGVLGAIDFFSRLPDREGHESAPDGIAIGSDGNLYVAHLGTGTVRVLDERGELIRTLPTGLYDTSNLVFGGAGGNQLFVTGSVGHRRDSPGRVVRLDLERRE